jgi:hypothetical protein
MDVIVKQSSVKQGADYTHPYGKIQILISNQPISLFIYPSQLLVWQVDGDGNRSELYRNK